MNYREKINLVKSAILFADENSSLQDVIDSEKNAFEGIRMLYSTDAAGAELQVNALHQDIFSGLFSKSKILAYSSEIAAEMQTRESLICYKRRVLFDTNLLSEIPRLVKGEDFKDVKIKEKVERILDVVINEYCGGFDYSFPMFENLREYTSVNNPYPIKKVAAALYFDDKSRGKEIQNVQSDDILEPYIQESESRWKAMRANEHAWDTIDRRDLVYVVMLKTYYLCWTSSRITIEDGLRQLVDFCLDKLGVLPLKELYFAWKVIIGFSINYFAPVFDEKPLKSPKKNSINRISALAWDLFIFRYTEFLLTEEKGTSFYVPTFTTLDQGLLATVNSCKVKAMISFPEKKFVETIFDDELHFQQCLNAAMTKKQQNILSDPNRSLKGNKKSRQSVSLSIFKLEHLIGQLL
ncbi:hypothetical protein RX455_003658 [Vibrio fluvialis]|nr:hypothetical protein [Vibrio fluvialis]